MGWLSTEAVIFSFEGGLSTDLRPSYSQGLIHRKIGFLIQTQPTGKPPCRAIVLEKGENRLHGLVVGSIAAGFLRNGLFTDAEAGEDATKQVIRAEGPGNFPE